MALRQKLNQNATTTTVAAAVITIIALAVVVWQMWPNKLTERDLRQYYFTTDDGASYFAEDLSKVPPFTVDGKEAYEARVYKCGWGKAFVGYLIRYTPEMKKKMEAAIASGEPLDPGVTLRGMEVKRPGDQEWLMATDDQGARISQVFCPDGTMNGLVTVFP